MSQHLQPNASSQSGAVARAAFTAARRSAMQLLFVLHHKLEFEAGRQEPRLQRLLGHAKTWEYVMKCYHEPEMFQLNDPEAGKQYRPMVRRESRESGDLVRATVGPSSQPKQKLLHIHAISATQQTRVTVAELYGNDDDDDDDDDGDDDDDDDEEEEVSSEALRRIDGPADGKRTLKKGCDTWISIFATKYALIIASQERS